MKSYYAYIRVSTVKQGERGSSLQEQRAAIEAYAARQHLSITELFEEKETAAKRGRPVFGRMLNLLREGRAQGVIIHKIDRSARNLRDWADINDLIDAGVEIHLAHENLDMHSRGGRLSADIQAVVAADYIRNLRDEVRKGMRGRLKQGLYPLRAPLGYRDNGQGKPKTLDPAIAPLVRRAFELYATGRYNLRTLGEELYRSGLRNRRGRRLSKNNLNLILKHEFYMGIMHIRSTGERYQGVHEVLVPKSLFDCVRSILSGKTQSRGWKHDFLYRRKVHCKCCGRVLIGERQKGHIYYRCHTRSCPQTPLREDVLNGNAQTALKGITLTPQQLTLLRAHIARRDMRRVVDRKEEEQAITIALRQLDDRMNRLTDAFIDQLIDKSAFEERKGALLHERSTLVERRDRQVDDGAFGRWVQEKLELIQSLSLSGSAENPEERLTLLKSASSNLTADGKYVVVEWNSPFRALVAREKFKYGGPYQDIARTGAESANEARSPKLTDEPSAGWAHKWCEAVCDELWGYQGTWGRMDVPQRADVGEVVPTHDHSGGYVEPQDGR